MAEQIKIFADIPHPLTDRQRAVASRLTSMLSERSGAGAEAVALRDDWPLLYGKREQLSMYAEQAWPDASNKSRATVRAVATRAWSMLGRVDYDMRMGFSRNAPIPDYPVRFFSPKTNRPLEFNEVEPNAALDVASLATYMVMVDGLRASGVEGGILPEGAGTTVVGFWRSYSLHTLMAAQAIPDKP